MLVPAGVDDPARVSGGNVYDREVRDGLRGRGWTVTAVEAADGAVVPTALDTVPDGALALVDGLVAGWAPAVLAAASVRLRVVVLAHMVAAAFPDASSDEETAERRALGCARRVIATSRWTAGVLVQRRLVAHENVTVAVPGASACAASGGGVPDGALICVGVIAPHKGQDVLLAALARLAAVRPAVDWTCTLVGSTSTFPGFAAAIAEDAAAFGGRVMLTGVRTGAELDDAYRRSAVLVAPSRVESAGMAITDALARGIPVIGAAVGGIPDTVASGGALLVAPDDPVAWADALYAWMTDAALRDRLRAEARGARAALPGWDHTVEAVERALAAA